LLCIDSVFRHLQHILTVHISHQSGASVRDIQHACKASAFWLSASLFPHQSAICSTPEPYCCNGGYIPSSEVCPTAQSYRPCCAANAAVSTLFPLLCVDLGGCEDDDFYLLNFSSCHRIFFAIRISLADFDETLSLLSLRRVCKNISLPIDEIGLLMLYWLW
jgi:hypothetical protein